MTRWNGSRKLLDYWAPNGAEHRSVTVYNLTICTTTVISLDGVEATACVTALFYQATNRSQHTHLLHLDAMFVFFAVSLDLWKQILVKCVDNTGVIKAYIIGLEDKWPGQH